MIHPSDIESKDFSIVLPELSLKLGAISSALIVAEEFNTMTCYSSENVTGFGLIIRDIMDDLEIVNKALYPDEDPARIKKAC